MLKTPRTSGPESLLLPYHTTTTLAGDNGRSPGIRGNQGPTARGGPPWQLFELHTHLPTTALALDKHSE